jgi:hypothetical protein
MPIRFTKTTHPISFSSLSGHEFERLVFAMLLRMRAWHALNWHGQSGGDGGRDIIGVCNDQYGAPKKVVVACANWKAFTLGKATGDIDSFLKTLGTPPNEVIIVAGSSVSADTKDKIDEHARSKNISESHTWSGSEVEELLRFHAPSVLDRFFHGVELPDDEKSLRDFMQQLDPVTAIEAAEMLANIFRRPAFETRIGEESSLPAFRQAIGDTIGALNTGIWRDREGAVIARIPSIASFSDSVVVSGLRACVDDLNRLRTAFDQGLRDKTVMPCGCGQADCPVFIIDRAYGVQLESLRSQAMRHARVALAALRAGSS